MNDSQELRVIHALRLKGFADTDVVAQAAGLDVNDTKDTLDMLTAGNHVKFRDGPMTGWMLTPAGRERGETLLSLQVDGAANRAELDALYHRFLQHNQPFLSLCTDWQTRVIDGAQLINDHSDPDYDAGIIDRLAETNDSIQQICRDLAAVFDRFAAYGPRFDHAVAKVQAGDIQWFTKPVIESYHTVWFELHEDLLASLGIERAKEGHA